MEILILVGVILLLLVLIGAAAMGGARLEPSWQQFCREIGGQLIPARYSKDPVSSIGWAPYRQWTVILDAPQRLHYVPQYLPQYLCDTRIRIPVQVSGDFAFSVCRRNPQVEQAMGRLQPPPQWIE